MGSTPLFVHLDLALVAMLELATQRPVGNHVAPGPDDEPAPVPYTVLRRLNPAPAGGDVAAPQSMLTVTYQLTVVGERADQAAALADKGQAAMCDRNATGWVRTVTVSGLNVVNRAFVDGGTDDEGGSWFNDARRYAVVISVV
jgi:hypothetical protein